MSSYADSLGISASGLGLLRDLVHEHTGLFFENGRSDLLMDKLSPLLVDRGITSLLDYYYVLKYDAEADREWRRVMDALSVPETFFWRSVDHVTALVDRLVPEHFARPGAGPLRIWSAACATGEEPLTIALALHEQSWFDRAAIEIVASDASSVAIEKARQGIYRERSFRNLPRQLRDRYFTEVAGGAWQASPVLRSKVKWLTANLAVESEIKDLASANVIFCRNVFIYFSEKSIARTLKTFHELMPPRGHLFVAAAELSMKVAKDFELIEIGDAFAYIKR
jgi:chemotaxis protein methyltransferase CheR